MFDPYHKWLGIPKDQRPPTFYQLLGLAAAETDLEVIEEAAIRQTAHIRTYQIGPHAKECTQILNEIAQARTTLLCPAKRKEYDALLAKKAADRNRSAEATQLTASPRPPASIFADLAGEGTRALPSRMADDKAGRAPSIRKKKAVLTGPLLYGIVGGGVGLALVVGLGLLLITGRSSQLAEAPVAAQKKDTKTKREPGQSVSQEPKPGPVASATKKDEQPVLRPSDPESAVREKKQGPPDAKEEPPQVTPKPAQEEPLASSANPSSAASPPPGEARVRHFGGEAPGAFAAMSSDGKLLAIAGPGRDLVVVDVSTGKEQRLATAELKFHHALFLKGGDQVLAAATAPKGALKLFNLKGGPDKQFGLPDPAIGFTFLALALNERGLLTGSTDATLRIWNLEFYQEVRSVHVKHVPTRGEFFDSNSKVLAQGMTDAPARPWYTKVNLITKVGDLKSCADDVTRVAIGKSGELMVEATRDHKLHVRGHAFTSHQAPIQSLELSGDENLLVSVDEKGQVSIWDVNERRELWRRFFPPAADMKAQFVGPERVLLVMGNGVDLVDWSAAAASPTDLAQRPEASPEPPTKSPKTKVSKESKKTQALLQRVSAAVRAGHITRTRQMGTGKYTYEEVPQEGALLIGFEGTCGKFGPNPTVTTFRPIFLTAAGRVLGATHGAPGLGHFQVIAKPGYAVGAVTIKAGLGVDGMSVTFMEVREQGLNPAKAYESDWYGGLGGEAKTLLAGSGAPVVGIFGRTADAPSTFNGLGLVTATLTK
jgi:hypothetical protein